MAMEYKGNTLQRRDAVGMDELVEQFIRDMKLASGINRQRVIDNIECIKEICTSPRSIDEIISMFFNRTGAKLSLYKYAVEG